MGDSTFDHTKLAVESKHQECADVRSMEMESQGQGMKLPPTLSPFLTQQGYMGP